MENKKQRIRDLTECPVCKESWDDGDIRDQLKASGRYDNRTDEELTNAAKSYGWTPENPQRFSKLIGIEVMGKYDGISYWKCPHCSTFWDRWTDEIVTNFDDKKL